MLIAANYSPNLKRFYERIKGRPGTGRASIEVTRKSLGIVYRMQKQEWVFKDFPNFILAKAHKTARNPPCRNPGLWFRLCRPSRRTSRWQKGARRQGFAAPRLTTPRN